MVTFFVVEDHTLTNLGIRELLSAQAGFSCAGSACTREEALTKLAQCSEQQPFPDLVLLDLFLGEESGIDIIRTVREQSPVAKILLYSMYAKPGIVTLALENGADGFVSKSASESELLTAIDRILAGERYVQQSLVPQLLTYRTMFDGLTKQEQNIFKRILERQSNEQIAKELNIVPRSLENYLSRIYAKTGCKNHEELLLRFGS